MKQYLKSFGPIMHSFRVFAWSLPLDFEIFQALYFDLSYFFILKIIFSKHYYSYMIVYMKSLNYVDYNNAGKEGGCKSPLIHLIFGPNYLAKPKDSRCQRYVGLMYGTYIFIFGNKTHGYLP